MESHARHKTGNPENKLMIVRPCTCPRATLVAKSASYTSCIYPMQLDPDDDHWGRAIYPESVLRQSREL